MTEALIGSHLGQYRLIEVIGHGGMSTVYKAHQESLNRFVAIKVLLHVHHPQFVERFKSEAKTIANMHHPNILPVYDYGEQQGLLYLVMQYVEGGTTLAGMLGTPTPPASALRLASQILKALDYAHARGVVHRDVKPGNVLQPRPDWPLLADFGIAKLLYDAKEATRSGVIVGTATYMAPEQATGRTVDARADLYSTGIVLYELLTGRVPFEGPSMIVLNKHISEPPPPPRQINPLLPAVVEPPLLRALAKDPADRYQNAQEMAAELERIAAQLDHSQTLNRRTELYQAGVRAFEAGQLEQAIGHLSELVALDPDYRDGAELLHVAQAMQDRAKTEARKLRDQTRERYEKLGLPPPATSTPTETGEDAPTQLLSSAPTPPARPPQSPGRVGPATPAPAYNTNSSATELERTSPGVTSNPPDVPQGSAGAGANNLRIWAISGVVLVALVLIGGGIWGLAQDSSSSAESTPPEAQTQPDALASAPEPDTAALPGEPELTPTAQSARAGDLPAAPVIAAPVDLSSAAITGTLSWHDQVLWNDAVTVVINDLPEPGAGNVYAAWLANTDESLPLGILGAGTEGASEVTYISPIHENLLGRYDQVFITVAAEDAATSDQSSAVMAGALPNQVRDAIRPILVRSEAAPNGIGFALGLRQEVSTLLRHVILLEVSFLESAPAAEKLAREQRHAEHLVNLIEGGEGQDLDGNGAIEGPGDGFGILGGETQVGYLQETIGRTLLAAASLEASPVRRRYADAAEVVGDANIRIWVGEIRDRAQAILAAGSSAEIEEDINVILRLAEQVMNGVDANEDQRIDPTADEGGVLVAYQQMQRMADVAIAPVSPGAAVTMSPNIVQIPSTPPLITIDTAEFRFIPRKITIPLGATVVWANSGPEDHSVTSEDSSFEQTILASGDTFRHTFTQVGAFPYYCAFHGAPFGTGMSGIIEVQERSPAAPR
jgi:serine/threonine protein kinase/plastocyanin